MKPTNYNIVQTSALPRQFLLSLSFVVTALFIAGSVRAGVCNQPPIPTPGQTVTWMNLGRVAHSVVSDTGAIPFDSGGMGAGNVFTVTYNSPGTYSYHSSTEPIWSGDQISGYKFSGSIVVQP